MSTPGDVRPVAYVDLTHVPPLRAGDTLILRDSVLVGPDGAVGLNPSPHWEVVRQDAPRCGQDTRAATSRVTAPCALPAGHAGMCSAEEE